jgi:NAD(P)-dependent dehydrogenase (short-subunit alcohol dehydrogenase family)
VNRFAETLAEALRDTPVRVFLISPGLVQTAMTRDQFADDAPWTPPELAPRLAHVIASGRADGLAGRYIHAEHDDIEDLILQPRRAAVLSIVRQSAPRYRAAEKRGIIAIWRQALRRTPLAWSEGESAAQGRALQGLPLHRLRSPSL